MVFQNLMLFLRHKFFQLSVSFERRVKDVINGHLDIVSDTFNIVRSANTLQESERDPQFRELIRNSVTCILADLNQMCEMVKG